MNKTTEVLSPLLWFFELNEGEGRAAPVLEVDKCNGSVLVEQVVNVLEKRLQKDRCALNNRDIWFLTGQECFVFF